MKTVNEILDVSIKYLTDRGIDRSRRLVEELLSHALNLPRLELYMQFDRPMQPQELDLLREQLKCAAKRMPWQYIVGKVEFLGCTLEVTSDVLIPRQETEILAERVLNELPQGACVVWDLCCGSGCLGVAIKKKRPDCHMILSDLSGKALAVAKKNAEMNEAAVDVRQGDLLNPFQGERTDVIVCNPPYIAEKDYKALAPEVRDWEPKMALVGKSNGFEFYERLAKEAPAYLKDKGRLYLEIGTDMGSRVKELFSHWTRVEVWQDWAQHDRFCLAER